MYHLSKQACSIFIIITMRTTKKKSKVKKNTNERLKLMQKHVALRLLWQMLLDAQKFLLLQGRAGLVREGAQGGWSQSPELY